MQIKERDRTIIEKILKYCDEINYSHNEYNRYFEAFKNVPTYKNAIALCLMQIGELSNKLSDEFKVLTAQSLGELSEE